MTAKAFTLAAILASTLALASYSSAAEADTFSLDLAAAGTELSLPVPVHGTLPLTLIRSGPKATQCIVDLSLSAFVGDEGDVAVVSLRVPSETGREDSAQQMKLQVPASGLLLVQLVVPHLSESKYTGRLVLGGHGHSPQIWKLVLAQTPQPATLVVVPSSYSLQVTNGALAQLFLWIMNPITSQNPGSTQPRNGRIQQLVEWISRMANEQPVITLQLRDKTGQHGIDGLYGELNSVTKAPDGTFSFGKNIDVYLNGQPVPDFTVAPPRGALRTVEQGGQSELRLALHDLRPGEYNTVLRVRSVNSRDDDGQKLSLIVKVRDSVWLAVGWLLVAVMFSFIATKVLSSQRQKVTLLSRIRDLRPTWLAQETPILPVVWVRAVLRQAESLSRRFWLTGGKLLEARVAQAGKIIQVLDQARMVRERLAAALLPQFVYVRAIAKLSSVLWHVGDEPLDDTEAASIGKQLSALEDWLRSDKQEGPYWDDLRSSVASLMAEVSPTGIPAIGRDLVKRFSDELNQALKKTPENLQAKIAIEATYAKLKILWERRSSGELPALVNVLTIHDDVRDLFNVADIAAWERLKAAHQSGELSIESPSSDAPEQLEAYAPLRFRVTTADPSLAQTFLFQQGLTFKWNLEMKYNRRKEVPERTLRLNPTTAEPRVVQYVPAPGLLRVGVTIMWIGDRLDIPPTDIPLAIAKSSDFSLFAASERVDMYSWLIAAATAIITGIGMFYIKNDTFGSFQDYLTLFIWGAGIDQGKNFLQSLQAYSSG